ncbi:steroidogenic acute regulatory protein, mitochondrial [Brienomyrus brachyistius]|uniref:steroidogenic acute regulatory protein, mitochondrial n=1 Tax=Brienomyrus brachyistius TaxID=42636 RepID=UPI0020B2EAD1|nr:steroidogenic acute regulatory protein, mitochondrial [Brienomyrus brachyistius]
MLPAVVKLCCGISYSHVRSATGLKRAAMAAIGQELAHLKKDSHLTLPGWTRITRHVENRSEGAMPKGSIALKEEESAYEKQGRDALEKALEIVENKTGWKIEISEENGDVIYSKTLPGARKVFRLEAVLDASPEELHHHLFINVTEMKLWNPNIQHIEVLKRVSKDTMVTHEVSAEAAGNLIGQRDFLSVRHCSKQKSCIYLAGIATHLESYPPQKGFVRAQDGPTCIIIQPTEDSTGRSRFTWLLNMDLKGWLPKSIVYQALPRAQADFTRHLRRRLSDRTPTA